MLLERTVINRCEILANGDVQVRLANEIYDDSVTPKARVEAVYDMDALLEEAVYDEEELVTEEVRGKKLISHEVPAITDVRSKSYHRYVVSSDKETPADVQVFLDNSKA